MEIMKVAVIGAGTMGNGIAHVFALVGKDVILIDISEEILERALSTISKNMDRQVKKGIIKEEDKNRALDMIEEITLETDIKAAVSKFFHTLVEIINTLYLQYDLSLVLSGGVFQNRVLLGLVLDRIPNAIFPNQIPLNDGGIALGQVMFVVGRDEH